MTASLPAKAKAADLTSDPLSACAVSDIRCTFATPAGSRDSIAAKLRKPEGFKGAPLFADDRAVDPVTDKECQIKPDPADAAKLMYTLMVTDFSRCGVLKRNVSKPSDRRTIL